MIIVDVVMECFYWNFCFGCGTPSNIIIIMPFRNEVPLPVQQGLKWIKRKTLLGRAPSVQARVYRPSSRESLLNWYILFKRGYIDHRVVSPYWTHIIGVLVYWVWWWLLLLVMWLLLLLFLMFEFVMFCDVLRLWCVCKWIFELL